jgi:hypothetical protein
MQGAWHSPYMSPTMYGPVGQWSYGSWIYNYSCNQCLSPLMLWVRILIRARCKTLCDNVCQWLVTGRWFSLGPPVSSNKTDRHDIAEILLKVALKIMKPTNHSQAFCMITWSNRPQVDMLHHYDTLSWFPPNLSLFILLNNNTVC